MNDQCLTCRNPIVMMCQQGTGFCSMNCHDEYVAYPSFGNIYSTRSLVALGASRVS